MVENYKRSRPKSLRIPVTADEEKQIRSKMKSAKRNNLSEFIRTMALNGEVKFVDLSNLKTALDETARYTIELNRIGNNLNQIAKKVNELDEVDKKDISEMQNYFMGIKKNYDENLDVLINEINKIRREG